MNSAWTQAKTAVAPEKSPRRPAPRPRRPAPRRIAALAERNFLTPAQTRIAVQIMVDGTTNARRVTAHTNQTPAEALKTLPTLGKMKLIDHASSGDPNEETHWCRPSAERRKHAPCCGPP